LELPYVGSVKLDEHPDLAKISNQDARWQPATEPGLEGTKSWRTQQAPSSTQPSMACRAVGKRVLIQTLQQINGWQDRPETFSARVRPA
jgi:hypothetical protein